MWLASNNNQVCSKFLYIYYNTFQIEIMKLDLYINLTRLIIQDQHVPIDCGRWSKYSVNLWPVAFDLNSKWVTYFMDVPYQVLSIIPKKTWIYMY